MVRLILLPGYLRIPYHRNYRFRQRYKPRTRSGPLNWFCQNYCRSDTVRVSTMQPRSNLAWQGVFKNGSRRRAEADFSARNTSASSPRRLRLLRRFLNSPCESIAGSGLFRRRMSETSGHNSSSAKSGASSLTLSHRPSAHPTHTRVPMS